MVLFKPSQKISMWILHHWKCLLWSPKTSSCLKLVGLQLTLILLPKMTSALLHVQQLLQPHISFPHELNTTSNKLTKNPRYNSKTQFLFRNLVYFSILFTFWFSIARLLWLQMNWKNFIPHKVEQLMVYLVTLCLTFIGLSSYALLIKYSGMLMFVVNQRLILVPPQDHLSNKFHNTTAYLFAISFSSFPLLVLGVPFARNYLPFQLTWNYFASQFAKTDYYKYISKVFESVIYVTIVSQAAGVILCIVLLLIVTSEGINIMCSQCLTGNRKRFMHCYKTNMTIRLLVKCMNIVAQHALYEACQLTVLLVSFCSYGLINLREGLPTPTVLAGFVIIAVCLCFSFGVFRLMDVPNSKLKKFRRKWQSLIGNLPIPKRILKSIPNDIGYKLGMFRNIKSIGGPKTLDMAIDCTINLLLMSL